jgi:hypothetical protein
VIQIHTLRVLVSRDTAPFRNLDSNIPGRNAPERPHCFVELRTGRTGTTHLTRGREESCGTTSWIGWRWKDHESKRPASFERGGPLCKCADFSDARENRRHRHHGERYRLHRGELLHRCWHAGQSRRHSCGSEPCRCGWAPCSCVFAAYCCDC